MALGPITIHFYALAILLGIIAAIFIGRARYKAHGGRPEEINEITVYVIPAGIIGGRLYHLATSPDAYFGAHGHPWDALKIWQGGLGIWGAVAVGTIVTYFLFTRQERSLPFPAFADALAPALLIAQAIGRWGNWFNAELFGKPSNLPWALSIPFAKRPAGYENFATFHPTFLYESIWCIAAALILMRVNWFAARFGTGSIFLGYLCLYTLGRLWIEALRIDTAHILWGLRLNIWVSLIVFLTSTAMLIRRNRTVR